MLNQVKCHVKLHGNKLGLNLPFSNELPENLIVGSFKSQSLIHKDWNLFLKFINGSLYGLELQVDKVIDFYHMVGAKGLEEKSAESLIMINKPDGYFIDSN